MKYLQILYASIRKMRWKTKVSNTSIIWRNLEKFYKPIEYSFKEKGLTLLPIWLNWSVIT